MTWHPKAVLVAVADRGGPAEPRVIADPDGERGRGLLVVQELSVRTGDTGDRRGRLVWAQVAWSGPGAPDLVDDAYQAAVREGEAALARRFAGVPAWFGRSSLAWWALVGSAGLVSAPTMEELAWLLYRLLDTAQPLDSGQARDRGRSDRHAASLPRRAGASGRDAALWSPGTASTGMDHTGYLHQAADGADANRRRGGVTGLCLITTTADVTNHAPSLPGACRDVGIAMQPLR